jgi:signal transduction histidine kinase
VACWLAPIAAGWVAAPPVLRATALIAASFAFPVLVHLALSSPAGNLDATATRIAVAAAYAWAATVSVLLALLRDPFYDPSCWIDCDGNAFLVAHRPEVAEALVAARPWAELALGAAVVVVAVGGLARVTGAARVARGASAALGAVAMAHAVALLSTPLEHPLDESFRGVFFASAGAVLLVAAAVIAPAVETARRRRAVIREVAALDEAPLPADLERTVGAALRDPALRIAFWLPALGCWADVEGREREPIAPAPRRVVTSLVRDGAVVAAIDHDEASAVAVSSALTPSVRLSMDNARLRAELHAQVRLLREARRRIVTDGDDERRRLERDLHDGVQQQLLAIAVELRGAAELARNSGDRTIGVLDGALANVAAVLEEVRSVAHGIYPAILTDAGLVAAVATLADVAALPVNVVHVPERRFPSTVEAAAYQVVAEGVANAVAYSGARAVAVDMAEADGELAVEVCDGGRGGAKVTSVGGLAELADRVGALDGTFTVSSEVGTGTSIRAVIPCVS